MVYFLDYCNKEVSWYYPQEILPGEDVPWLVILRDIKSSLWRVKIIYEEMKIWVQSKKTDKAQPFSLTASICLDGFIKRGHYAEFFSASEIDTIEFEKVHPVVAGVGTFQRIFAKLGVKWNSTSYPESLENFLGRKTGYVRIADLTNLLKQRTVFIKPAADDKSFTGFVCKKEDDRWHPNLCSLPNDALLAWSDPVSILTEYRVYVLHGRIQNICRYRGPIDHQPDPGTIREMIEAYVDSPIAYGMDVGVLDSGKTVLVEINEALALGNYGLPSMLQAKMVAARWFELMGDKSRMYDEADAQDSPPFINEL